MKPAPSGNGFYECLKAELRGIMPLPAAIKTRQDFDIWVSKNLSEQSLQTAMSLSKIEQLFENRLKIIVEDATSAASASSIDATNRKSSIKITQIRMLVENGIFTSKRHKSTGSALSGLDSLEFWLENLAIHLNKAHPATSTSSSNSSLIFIVGTHLDQAVGSTHMRSESVLDIVKRLNIQIPVSIHEISLYPMEGCPELMPGLTRLRLELYDGIRKLPHMGEKVPKSYLQVMKGIETISEERRLRGESLI